jgi:hypothetical protein
MKAEALRIVKLPLEGLGFDDEGVTYNGVPFKQSSGAEQLRVSVAMAMALNPTIRVLRVKDGSLLDDENMSVLEGMAKENDFQIWIEVVKTNGVGFILEDGEIIAQGVTGGLEALEHTRQTRVETSVRMSLCSACGETKVADPTSRFFEARPDSDMDFDWDGCSEGSGT